MTTEEKARGYHTTYCSAYDPHKHRPIGFEPCDCGLSELLDQHGKEREITGLRKAEEVIPGNWLDPMLSGPEKVLAYESDCRDIEAVLRECSKRITALADELEGS
ncbi:MAG: hypothetical protein ACPGVG_05340 [Mycobacterium sp.]